MPEVSPLRGGAQAKFPNVATSGSMNSPQRKPWSQEDSESSHPLIPNSGGQSPRSPALGRGPKGLMRMRMAGNTSWGKGY